MGLSGESVLFNDACWFEDLWWEMAWCECEKREGSAEWWKTGLDRQRRGEVVWARSEENCASKVTERASVWKRERECLCVGGRRRAGTEWSHKRVKVGNRDNQELAKEGVRRCFGKDRKEVRGEEAGEGREKVSVTVTESDTKLWPKLIACLLISPANDCHSLSQSDRNRNPCSSVLTFTSWIMILINSLNMESRVTSCVIFYNDTAAVSWQQCGCGFKGHLLGWNFRFTRTCRRGYGLSNKYC